jgi:acetoin:2,6-dichlorophenolindophenol oxidoreductase subunit alpha
VIHVKLTRYYGHFEGDAMTYRGPGEVDQLKAERDCLALFRQRVIEAGLLEADQLDAIDREARQVIDQALAAAKAAPAPREADLLTDVYASY